MLIAIEGLDAAGKNTQTKRLCERFVRNGRAAKLFSFPRYDTAIGRVIRAHLHGEIALLPVVHASMVTDDVLPSPVSGRAGADPLMFQCLMLADKYDAAAEIRTLMKAGVDVVCDRWIPSSLCYGAADGLDQAWLASMHSSLPAANLNVFLDISAEEALKRRPSVRDRYERDRAKQTVVRANYATLWMENEGEAWRVVDGAGTEEEVADRIWREVVNLYGRELR